MAITLKAPFCITSRLCAGIRIGDTEISIEYADRAGREGRTRYRYYIDGPWGGMTADDIQSGCQGGSIREGLSSLLSFLSAAGEALRYEDAHGCEPGEDSNADLFPRNVTEFAAQYSDEISMAQLELEETSDAIVE